MGDPGESIKPEQGRLLLERALALFVAETSLIPVIGGELEFFLSPNDKPVPLESLLYAIQVHSQEASLPLVSLETERGGGQYEIQVDHSRDVLWVADALSQLPGFITKEAEKLGLQALFDAKPYANQPGSSLHIHVGLYNANGVNVLMRVGREPFLEESALMRHAIGGLLAAMQESLAVFCPGVQDYARFEPKQDAPTTVSWGGNNRTVALRIPASSWLLEPTRHIEHRIPAANANPYLTLAAILAGIHQGITQKIEPTSPKIYGDASLPLYNLERLAASLEEAERFYEAGAIVKPFFCAVRMIAKREYYWLVTAFFAYVALTLTSFAFYEPWRDEADVWLVVQDMSIPQLFHHLQYAGHQALWYLILMPFAKAGLPYITMHAVHFSVVYSAVLVFLFRAPFPVITKIFFLFSFFMSFEYALVARNYAISLLLLFLIATWFPRRFERPFIYALLVFLLFNTNVVNLGAAGLFMGEFIWEVLWKRERRNIRNVAPMVIMMAGMGIALYQLYPSAPDIAPEFKGFTATIRPYMFLGALVDSILAGVSNERQMLFFLLFSFGIFCIFIQLLDKDKKILLFVYALMAWLFYLFGFKYGGFLRHHTFILIYIILAYWLSTYSTGKTLSPQSRKQFTVLLTAILAYSSFVSFTRHYESMIETTSGSKAVAEFIIKNGHVNDTIIADRSEYFTSVLPYLREVVPGKKIWFAYKKDFGSNGPFDAAFWLRYPVEEIMQNSLSFAAQYPKDKVLVVLSYPLDNPGKYGLKEVFVKRAIIRPTWSLFIHRSESFWVYAFNH